MRGVSSEKKDKVQPQDGTLEDHSSDSSLANHQLKVLKDFDLLRLTTQ